MFHFDWCWVHTVMKIQQLLRRVTVWGPRVSFSAPHLKFPGHHELVEDRNQASCAIPVLSYPFPLDKFLLTWSSVSQARKEVTRKTDSFLNLAFFLFEQDVMWTSSWRILGWQILALPFFCMKHQHLRHKETNKETAGPKLLHKHFFPSKSLSNSSFTLSEKLLLITRLTTTLCSPLVTVIIDLRGRVNSYTDLICLCLHQTRSHLFIIIYYHKPKRAGRSCSMKIRKGPLSPDSIVIVTTPMHST